MHETSDWGSGYQVCVGSSPPHGDNKRGDDKQVDVQVLKFTDVRHDRQKEECCDETQVKNSS